jgi:hypothetical protein
MGEVAHDGLVPELGPLACVPQRNGHSNLEGIDAALGDAAEHRS